MGWGSAANKYHWRVWGVLTVSGPHWICPCSRRVCFPGLHCSGSRLLCRSCLKQALHCLHFPGLGRSGSGSWVLHKGTDSVGPAFYSLPRCLVSTVSPGGSVHLITSPVPAAWFPDVQWACRLRCAVPLLWGADLWLRSSWRLSTIQDPRKT